MFFKHSLSFVMFLNCCIMFCEFLCPNFKIHSLIQCQDFTGKSLSKALILGSTNPQYDKRLFIDLPVQYYMKITSSEHVVYTVHKLVFVLTFTTIHVLYNIQGLPLGYIHNMFSTCSELVIFMYWTRNSMKNLSSYCGLVDARTSASDKYLPVHGKQYL